MSKFFGSNLFKRTNSTNSVTTNQKSANHRDDPKSITGNSSVMWETICDLNSSSDLDESTDFFYPRPNLFSPGSDKCNSPFTIPDKSSSKNGPATTNTKSRWKTNFLLPESSNPKSNRMNEIKCNSPSIARSQTKSQSSSSLGFRYVSNLSKSPVLKSPSGTLNCGIEDIDEPDICHNKRSSPKVVIVAESKQNVDAFTDVERSLDISTDDTNQTEKDNEDYSIGFYHSDSDRIKESNVSLGPTRTQENEIISNGPEKLDFLHMKLKNEAVKLENWKNDMLQKLSQNEEQLNEANVLIANLRKSNLELQMQTENASLKLKDEVEKREATEKKIIGTRDLCEVIRTQIELVRSTCSSTMQTCFKTTTIQKSLEVLLKDAYEDFSKLKNKLDKVDRQKRLEEEHNKMLQVINCQIADLRKENEKYMKEKIKNDDFMQKFDESLQELMIKIQNTGQDMTLLLEQSFQARSDLETEIQMITRDFEKLNLYNREKECQLIEATNKCSQLEDDLKRVYAMMQNSKNSCLERSKKITELEGEIKQLTDKINQLQEDCHKKDMDCNAERRSRQKELVQIIAELTTILPAIDFMALSREENIRLFEKENGNIIFHSQSFSENLQERLSISMSKLRCAENKESGLVEKIMEYEKLIQENTLLIDELKHFGNEKLREIENLKIEISRCESYSKDLEEAHNKLKESFANSEKLLNETKNKLSHFEIFEESQNKEKAELRNGMTKLQDEIEDLSTKLRNAEFERGRLTARNQDISRCIELKNDQIVRLEERLQESEQQVRVLENAASRAGDEMRASSALLAQRDAELTQLRDALAAAQAAHAAATKRCEEIRAELLGAVEQQQQESDRALRQKEKQIESLQENLDSLQKKTDKSSKRIEKELTENTGYMEKLKDQLKECSQEKVGHFILCDNLSLLQKEMAKQLAAIKQKTTKLEKDRNEKKAQISDMEEKIEHLNGQLKKLDNEKNDLMVLLDSKQAEVERLRRIEAEFADFKRSVTENTPPCSTQISMVPDIDVQMTPKSPFRAVKFNQTILLKTPQKTPKSILKQPGSECKRRRVLLISPEREVKDSDSFDIQNNDSSITVDLDTTPDVDNSPKNHLAPRTPNVRGTPQTRAFNIRKTPSTGNANRGPPTNTRSSSRQIRLRNPAANSSSAVPTTASESSWFDSEETFGLGAEE